MENGVSCKQVPSPIRPQEESPNLALLCPSWPSSDASEVSQVSMVTAHQQYYQPARLVGNSH